MREKWISSILVVTSLMGCGKSGGGSSDVTERPSGAISGTAFDGLIKNGDVTVFTLDGSAVGTTKTDDKGIYSMGLSSVPSQPLKLVISSGTYKEEYSGESVVLKDGKKISALINYIQGESISTSVTYFTTIAAGLAEYNIASGMDRKTAIDESNKSVSQIIGIDILKVTPVDITDELEVTPSLSEGQIYGYFTSSVSAYTAWISDSNSFDVHEAYNSIVFAQMAYEDIKFDGKLDGVGEKGALAMGKVLFSPDTYRYELALNMLVMANHENNKLGYAPADLSKYSKTLNESANPVFAGAAIRPLNANGTVISNASWLSTDAFYGEVTLSVSAFDVVGITAATLTINGVTFFTDNLESPSFNFDSTQFADGSYDAVIAVTNATNVVTEFKQEITFANRATAIVTTNPVDGQAVGGIYEFGASVADPFGVDRVTFIFDESITMDAPDSSLPAVKVDTKNTLGSEGKHRLVVRATGRSGYEATKEINFVIDNTAPTVESNLGDGAFVSSVYTLTTAVNDNLGIKSASVKIDGREIQSIADKGRYTVPFDPQAYSEGPHTLVIEVFDKANNRTALTRNFFIDRNPPIVNITTPSGTLITGALNVTFEASDTLGFGANKIVATLEGYPVPLATLDSNVRSFRLDPYTLFWGEGNSRIIITVTDGSGKVATDAINVNFQHIPTWLVLGGSSTDSDTFRTQHFSFGGASGRQTINSIRFNGEEVTQNSINDPLVPWSPNVVMDGASSFSLITWLATKPHSCEAIGTLTYAITDEYGVRGEGSINNFAWCNNHEYTTATAWAFLQAW